MKFKCLKCDGELERVTKASELPAMPFDWYDKPEVFENEIILQCKACKMFMMLSKWDKIKWRIANKIMEM